MATTLAPTSAASLGDSICRPSVDFTRASSLALEEQARHIGGFLSGALKTIR